ncbi:MAG: hypothetical protein KBD66_00900 [Candidatus Doudnabacteria bacterium]|nr:hypothetical protein [Candidatus Doudnabacteria bacterium]
MQLPAFLSKLNQKKSAASVPLTLKGLNQTAVAVVVVLLALALDVWFMQNIFRTIYRYKFADVGARTVLSTRVNFTKYGQVIDKMQKGEVYESEPLRERSPFTPVPKVGKGEE